MLPAESLVHVAAGIANELRALACSQLMVPQVRDTIRRCAERLEAALRDRDGKGTENRSQESGVRSQESGVSCQSSVVSRQSSVPDSDLY